MNLNFLQESLAIAQQVPNLALLRVEKFVMVTVSVSVETADASITKPIAIQDQNVKSAR